MTIEQIKAYVDNGYKVFNTNSNYEVIKDNKNQYLVICKLNNYTVGIKGMPIDKYYILIKRYN
tara:strand:+ start:289 stop:477 length:189 start_codon:yes stop_codon:yes gene_type:complete